jgi:two-component system response regulator AtoC
LTVAVAANGADALAQIGASRPDVIITDVRMDQMDGLELLRTIRQRSPEIDVVLMTAYDDMPTVAAAMRDGAVEFLSKPLDLNEVRAVIRRVFEDRRAKRKSQNGSTTDSPAIDGLVGRTPAMISIYKLIGHTAATRAAVLIRGESGTGKELVARAIHHHGPDSGEPFVAVNCAALPATLLESELFGHVRGAFTGAVNARRGRFAQAGKGTIFLDEIGDTSPDFQSKLLRVLQDREYQPVGAERVERTDARVIAATHQDLESQVSEKRFRADLYYRLRVVEIVIPPLRERKSDIPLLVDHMINRAVVSLAAPRPIISDEAMQKLIECDWPGNVRELENCVTRAAVLASGSVIRPEHLVTSSTRAAGERIESLHSVERQHLVRALAATGGHKAAAAQLLGVSRPRLNRLIEKHGL